MITIYYKKNIIEFLKIFLITLLIFCIITLIFDTIELSKITSQYFIQATVIIQLAVMKSYNSVRQSIPIIILVSSSLYFYLKSKKNDLVTARIIAISNLDILLPVLSIVVIIGIINITVINQIGSVLVNKYQYYKAIKFRQKSNIASTLKNGVWLKSKTKDSSLIINALKVLDTSKTVTNSRIFLINYQGEVKKQIFSKSISFSKNYIVMNNSIFIEEDFSIIKKRKIKLPIKILLPQILDYQLLNKHVPLLELLYIIKAINKCSLSSTEDILSFLKELLSPFHMISMCLISFFFSHYYLFHKNSTFPLIYCVATGATIFFCTNLIYALGASGNISVYIAAFFPTIIFNILPLYCILNKAN